MEKHKCVVGSYMADPEKGAWYVRIKDGDDCMLSILMEKVRNKAGRLYRFCPDCGKEIRWKTLGGSAALYILDTF